MGCEGWMAKADAPYLCSFVQKKMSNAQPAFAKYGAAGAQHSMPNLKESQEFD
jgi:hypothetical protein